MTEQLHINTYFTSGAFLARDTRDPVVVVFDVLRSTSCMVQAFVNGAEAIFPALNVDEARQLAEDRRLLAGEINLDKVDGFDLGNSPSEFTGQTVKRREIVYYTNNGTRALRSVPKEQIALVGSLFNMDALVRRMENSTHFSILCSGFNGLFAFEDVYAAGTLIIELMKRTGLELNGNSESFAAVQLATHSLQEACKIVRDSRHGQQLVDRGHGPDIERCLQLNTTNVVPIYRAHLNRMSIL